MRKFLVALLLLIGVPATASATIMTVNVSGTFAGAMSGDPYPGVFPGGTPFSLHFTYDSNATGVPDASGFLTRYMFASGATFTAGGQTTSGGFSLEAIDISGSGLLAGLFDLGAGPGAGERRGLTLLSAFAPGALPGQLLPSNPAFFTQYAFSAQVYDLLADGQGGPDTLLRLNNSDAPLTISASGGAVPEPGTWAMMLTGFGIVGLATRRRLGAVMIANQAERPATKSPSSGCRVT